MNNFAVGQKVVCIDPNPYALTGRETGLKMNATYTVTKTHNFIQPMISVCEVGTQDFLDAFRSVRFRAAVERKTDISIFTKILDDASKKQLVGAR